MPHLGNRFKTDLSEIGIAMAFPARSGVRMPVQSEAEPNHRTAEALPFAANAGLGRQTNPRLSANKLSLDVGLFRISHLNAVPGGATV